MHELFLIIYKILMERKPKIVLYRGLIKLNGVFKFEIASPCQGLDSLSNE